MSDTKNIDVEKLKESTDHQGYIHRELVAIDELANTTADGPNHDTISSRMERWKDGIVPKPNRFKKLWGRFMCWWLGDIQPRHDLKANVGDWERSDKEKKRTEKTLKANGLQIDRDGK